MAAAPLEGTKSPDTLLAAENVSASGRRMPISTSESGLPPGRVLFINDRSATSTAMAKLGLACASNVVRTSKYSVLSFIPKNLMEQFRRVANFYFLIISLLQLATPYSPTNQYSTIGPLVLVLVATMIKEAVEDKVRHDADKTVNRAKTLVFVDATRGYQERMWQELQVGDVVKVLEGECFPADLVLLESSNIDGQAQVETANLDGETDLKQEGRLAWEVPLTITNIVLRGMKLSHTTYVEGVVVASGAETKLIQNTKQSPSKFSRLDVIANRCILVIFSVLCIVCCVSTAWSTWRSTMYFNRVGSKMTTAFGNTTNWSYLWDQDIPSTFITFLILYNNLVPISLYISLEVVKWYQAKQIESDPEMLDPVTGRSVQARTSNLNEDVGQIRYLFSDKTGMISMFNGDKRIDSSPSLHRNAPVDQVDRITTRLRAYSANVMPYSMLTQHGTYPDHGAGCDATTVMDDTGDLSRGVLVQTFFRCVLLCHTATLSPENAIRASSPDETALLRGAVELNCVLKGRTSTTMDISLFGRPESYEILALNEFDSTRKCMSIVVRQLTATCQESITKDDVLWVFCKGADTTMMASGDHRHHTAKVPTRDSITSHLHYFASMGLRTLVFGHKPRYKRITLAEFMAWSAAYAKAKTSLVDRESKLIECARSMETRLTLLGATGVEDQLQDGVTECIETLSAAGYIHTRLWKPDVPSREIALVINGDALECLMNETRPEADNDDKVSTGRFADPNESTHSVMGVDESNHALGYRDSSFQRTRPTIKGLQDTHSNSDDNDAALALFMQLVTQCCSVIACRLSPIHKAQIIALIKRSKSRPVTMAVGDGGNDVSMIQEAHIGVGIFGHEAVRSADFAIGQFRFLSRLILAHGRWNYRRVSIVILFSFYKNMTLVMTLFMYSFLNGYSGQTMYESYLIVGWNVLYTLFPILVLGTVVHQYTGFFTPTCAGIIDEDISSNTVLKYPFIFRNNQMGQELNLSKMRMWVGKALWHSFLVFSLGTFLTYNAFGSYSMADSSIFLYGTAVYGILVVTVSLKAALIMQRLHRWTRYHYFAIVGGPVSYLAFVLSYSEAYGIVRLTTFSDFYGLGSVIFGGAAFWITICLVGFTSIVADVVGMYISRMYLPTNQDIIEEIDSHLDDPCDDVATVATTASRSKTGSVVMVNMKQVKIEEVAQRKILSPGVGGVRKDLGFLTEHEELCRKLMRQERAISREVGVHRQEVFDVGISSTSQISLHPITVEFMGEDHDVLEAGYTKLFVAREVRRIHVLVAMFLFLLPFYAVVEYYWEKDQSRYLIRVGMFCGTLMYLTFLHSRFFLSHYQLAILVPMAMGGIAFTQAIEYTGLLLVTIFTILLFSVVRVKVVYAICLAVFNLLYFDLSPRLGFRSSTKSSETTATEIVLFLVFMMFLIACSAFGSYILQVSMRTDFVQNRILVYEERRSREILSNMLPEHIVRRMQNGEKLISEEEKDVTILFCDIADFSSLIKRYSPTEMVMLLDRIYSLFDAMCAKHGMRKMETVGKTYLACAGLQGSVKGKEAALRAAGVAQDMMAAISRVKASNGNGLKIRIGIHSGRVISGLVGMKKQQFSLFGDTINTASRMQSTGVTGRIQVSQVTYDYLCHDFRFEPRTVEAKGKGTLTAYLMGKSATVLGDRAMRGHWDAFPDPRTASHIYHIREWLRRLFAPTNRIEVMASTVENTEMSMPTRMRLQGIRTELSMEIDPIWLFFVKPELELAYRKARCFIRQNGARRTMIMLAIYLAYTILRDLVHDMSVDNAGVLQNNATICDHSCKSAIYASTAIRGFLIGYAGWFEYSNFYARRAVDQPWLTDALKAFIRPVHATIFVYYIVTSVILVTPNIFRWANEQQSILYSYISMDIIMPMFLVSSGGSLLNKFTSYFNGLLMALSTIIYLVWLEGLKVYPTALTLFVGLFSTMARRDIEFFCRRKYWFQARAQMETKKADRLLYKMLPQSVVNQLKEGELVCDQHHHVGILFSDIKGFTSIAARADTDIVVHLLDSLFSAFDVLTEKHGVFKMQTIGDAYVIVSGLPYVDMSSKELNHLTEPNADELVTSHEAGLQSIHHKPGTPSSTVKPHSSGSFRHLESLPPRLHIRNLIRMATDMQREVAKVMDPNSGEPLQMRIGIHIGSIIAGVIGTSTLRYDMWGPDVLTANEMETSGVPGRILWSQHVHQAEDCPDLRFTFHKSIDFTGIAKMDTYIADFTDDKVEKHNLPVQGGGKPYQYNKSNDRRDGGKKDFSKFGKTQPQQDKKPYVKPTEEEAVKPNEKLISMLKSMKDQSVAWHEAVKALPNESKDVVKHKASDPIVDEKKRLAERLMEAELKAADSKGSLSSDEKYLKTMIKSGTLADRIAATTLSIQASPVHNLARLSQLVTMAKNKGRREAQMAIDSLKDLFLTNLLPDRKLLFFHQRPIHRTDATQAHVVIWYFEHCVKVAYAQLIAALASGMDDAIEAHKRACIRAVIALLTDKPEQENVLLTMLVNKLGDPDRKVASFVLHQLQELLKVHPVMKRVVVDDVERLLTRAKVTERTKYNAVLFLNQMYLSASDADLATHLIKVYFGLFSKEVHRDQGKADTGLERKLLSALLVGVNRSFPYAKCTSADFQDEIDTMFRVVHTAHFSTSVQALMLLFQVMSSTNSVPDRFYSALYTKLFDPKMHTTSKHTLFLNLLFRAIKQDVSPARVHAMIKRLLQVSLTMPPAFCCAALFLVSELLQHNKSFHALIDQPEHDLTQDQVPPSNNKKDDDTVESSAEDEDASDDQALEAPVPAEEDEGEADLEAERKRSAALLKSMGLDVAPDDDRRSAVKRVSGGVVVVTPYDPRKRNPLYAGAETSCLWELQPFLVHYHPSVAQFAKQLVDGAISYKGDPLNDFTLSVFFDKFVNKKPKSKDGPHRYSHGGDDDDDKHAVVGVHSEHFLAQDEAAVADTDRFFYTFFKERAKRSPFADADEYLEAIERGERDDQAAQQPPTPKRRPLKKRK
ncbi:hypothetical protein DYB25_001055 [Aphanomyces astaci]|uniref:P-type phospholipid transporter n=1 Tax=Aphanomyces astaci TaxID=112090 RepID=A0A396ZU91_APHAT|nr:hypothetical protein DYB25_001055 [Aphanomyces astaci]